MLHLRNVNQMVEACDRRLQRNVANDPNKPKNFILNFSAGALSSQSNLVNIKTTKHSHIVPKELFRDLIARNGNKLIKNPLDEVKINFILPFDHDKNIIEMSMYRIKE